MDTDPPAYLTRSNIGELLDQFNITPSRALGQNFLCDRGTVEKIVRLSGVGPHDQVVEIGAGAGSLTVGLIRSGARVLAVEQDRRLAELLGQTLGGYGVEIHQADAREFEWTEHLGARPWHVVANLPYNISTPLILDMLAERPEFSKWLVMVQRESGERLVASPGSRIYGIPSVLLAYWGTGRIVGTVGADVFLPRPRVDSVLVEIERHSQPVVDIGFDVLARVVRCGFGQRRKMLRRSLSGMLDVAQIESAGVDPTDRAEQLDLGAWARLAHEVSVAAGEGQHLS